MRNCTFQIGPSTISVFKSFVTRLHDSNKASLRAILCVKILNVLKDISSQRYDAIY